MLYEVITRKLLAETELSLVFSGGPGDAPACAELAEKLGDRAQNMARITSYNVCYTKLLR